MQKILKKTFLFILAVSVLTGCSMLTKTLSDLPVVEDSVSGNLVLNINIDNSTKPVSEKGLSTQALSDVQKVDIRAHSSVLGEEITASVSVINHRANASLTLKPGSWTIGVTGKNKFNRELYYGEARATVAPETTVTRDVVLEELIGTVNMTIANIPDAADVVVMSLSSYGMPVIQREFRHFNNSMAFPYNLIAGEWTVSMNIQDKAGEIRDRIHRLITVEKGNVSDLFFDFAN